MSRISIGPNVRFSYAFVFSTDDRGKYTVDCLIHKSDTAALTAVFNAYGEEANSVMADPKFPTIKPGHPSFKMPIKDGDVFKPNDAVYANHYYFTAKSSNKPEVVDSSGRPLTNDTEFYSGCRGFVSIEFKRYSPSPKVPDSGYGIRVMLGNLMKVSDDTRLSGGASASQDFKFQPTPNGAPLPGYGLGAHPQQAPFGTPPTTPGAGQQWGAPTAPPQPFAQPAPAWQQPAAPQPGPAPQQWGPPAAPQGNPFTPPAQQGPPAQQAPAPQQWGPPAQPQAAPSPVAAWPTQGPPGYDPYAQK